jgi:hypothetical protein
MHYMSGGAAPYPSFLTRLYCMQNGTLCDTPPPPHLYLIASQRNKWYLYREKIRVKSQFGGNSVN